MPNRLIADVWFGDLVHGDRCLHPHVALDLFQRVGQCQGIDGGGQHPHMVRTGTVHFAAGAAPPEIAAADHNSNFYAGVRTLLDGGTDAQDGVKIQAGLLVARHGLPAEFQ